MFFIRQNLCFPNFNGEIDRCPNISPFSIIDGWWNRKQYFNVCSKFCLRTKKQQQRKKLLVSKVRSRPAQYHVSLHYCCSIVYFLSNKTNESNAGLNKWLCLHLLHLAPHVEYTAPCWSSFSKLSSRNRNHQIEMSFH